MEITALSNFLLLLNTLDREGSFECYKGISLLDEVTSVCEPRKQGIIVPSPWNYHLPCSHSERGNPLQIKVPPSNSHQRQVCSSLTPIVRVHHWILILAFPRLCGTREWRFLAEKTIPQHSGLCVAASSQSRTGSITRSSMSKCVPDVSRDLSKSQTCLGGIYVLCVTILF